MPEGGGKLARLVTALRGDLRGPGAELGAAWGATWAWRRSGAPGAAAAEARSGAPKRCRALAGEARRGGARSLTTADGLTTDVPGDPLRRRSGARALSPSQQRQRQL